jgi:mRNA degradation ribonuclease J1/J2
MGALAPARPDRDEQTHIVRTVQPEILIPIHTEHPEWWEETLRGTGIKVEPPALGEAIPL